MLWPGLAIFVTVLAFNLFGDGLRDALDPPIPLSSSFFSHARLADPPAGTQEKVSYMRKRVFMATAIGAVVAVVSPPVAAEAVGAPAVAEARRPPPTRPSAQSSTRPMPRAAR